MSIYQKSIFSRQLMIAAAIAILCIVAVSNSAATDPYDVVILSSSDSGPHNEVINTINSQLDANPYIDTKQTLILVDGLDADSKKIDAIRTADVVITVGLHAIEQLLKIGTDRPVLATLVPKRSFRHVMENARITSQSRLDNISAIYLDNPPERQLLLAELLLGPNKRLGVISSEYFARELTTLIKFSARNHIHLISEKFDPKINIISQISRLLNKSDALLAYPDPLIFNRNTARNILLTSYRHRVPLITYSKSYVEAGALAAIYSSTSQIATQASEVTLNILGSNLEYIHHSEYPKYFSVVINHDVARSLGIAVSDEKSIKQKITALLEAKNDKPQH